MINSQLYWKDFRYFLADWWMCLSRAKSLMSLKAASLMHRTLDGIKALVTGAGREEPSWGWCSTSM